MRKYIPINDDINNRILDSVNLDINTILNNYKNYIPLIDLKIKLSPEWCKELIKSSFDKRIIIEKEDIYEDIDVDVIEYFFESEFDIYLLDNMDDYKDKEIQDMILELLKIITRSIKDDYKPRLSELFKVVLIKCKDIESSIYSHHIFIEYLTDLNKLIKYNRYFLTPIIRRISVDDLISLELSKDVIETKYENVIQNFHITIDDLETIEKTYILIDKLNSLNVNYKMNLNIEDFSLLKSFILDKRYNQEKIIMDDIDFNDGEKDIFIIKNKLTQFYSYVKMDNKLFELFLSKNNEDEIKKYMNEFYIRNLSKKNFLILNKYANFKTVLSNYFSNHENDYNLAIEMIKVHGENCFKNTTTIKTLIEGIINGDIELNDEIISILKIKRSLRLEKIWEFLNLIISEDIDIKIDCNYISFSNKTKFFDENLELKLINLISLYGANILKLNSLSSTKMFKKLILLLELNK